MSKFALLALGLFMVLVTSNVSAAEVVDVSEGYNGIKWGETFDTAFAKLIEKYGPRNALLQPLDIEGFEGKKVKVTVGGVVTDYGFIGNRFYYFKRDVHKNVNRRYTKEEFDKEGFIATVKNSFKTSKDLNLDVNASGSSDNSRLTDLDVSVNCWNKKIYDEEFATLSAGRPEIKKMLLDSILQP